MSANTASPLVIVRTVQETVCTISVKVLLLMALLSACSGGSDGEGQVGLSSAQDPDPAVLDVAIAYIRRPLQTTDNGSLQEVDYRDPAAFNPGAELFLRDRASPSASARNITAQLFEEGELYDVKDLAVSYDGDRLLFALRAPEIEDLDEDEQPTWNIWQYTISEDQLERVIQSDISAELGDDLAPAFLADDRIIFSSSRQRDSRAILLDENKPQYPALGERGRTETLNLHRMGNDGSNIEQISFNQSHDLDASLLDDGRMVFARWDNAAGRNRINLYTANPDGSDTSILYGHHSHDAYSADIEVQYIKPRQADDGRLLTLLRPFDSIQLGGDAAFIDVLNYFDAFSPVDSEDVADLGAQEKATLTDVQLTAPASPGGYYQSVFPLRDGSDRMIASWSECRLTDGEMILPCTQANRDDGALRLAAPLYGIWMFDFSENTQLPVLAPEEGVVFSDVITLQERALPDDIPGETRNEMLRNDDLASVHIASVYDLDGVDIADPNIASVADPSLTPVVDRAARFLRVVKPVSIPDEDVFDFNRTAFGRSAAQSMREIVGYVPIEPDGSVEFLVPARTAFSLSVLDAQGRRISQRHNNWMHLMPGETLQCNGCHQQNSTAPHGRPDAQLPSANPGAAAAGVGFPNSLAALSAAVAGQTMAQVYSATLGIRPLDSDLEYTDEWTDPAMATPGDDLALRYADLATPAPSTLDCLQQWQVRCRVLINYETHIQPLWSVVRTAPDPLDPIQDRSCITCHAPQDDQGVVQVPAAQLDLSGIASTDEPDHLVSYRELLFPDVEQEEIDGVLVDRLIPRLDGDGNQVFQTDADGNLLLDADGNPIPVLDTVPVRPLMSVNGAFASDSFFAEFDAVDATHSGWLSDAERRLLHEWLDIGAQYFNNPFDAPVD